MSDDALMFNSGFFLGAIAIGALAFFSNEGKLADCAKQHNVYACEYVAVPKKEGE
jgi:hypothetical protein